MIPVGSSEAEEELNKFLRSHRVLDTEQYFVSEKGYWAISVKYADQDPIAEAPPRHRKEKIDFTVNMSEEEKGRYLQVMENLYPKEHLSRACKVSKGVPFLIFHPIRPIRIIGQIFAIYNFLDNVSLFVKF